jgi:hypothetical protein
MAERVLQLAVAVTPEHVFDRHRDLRSGLNRLLNDGVNIVDIEVNCPSAAPAHTMCGVIECMPSGSGFFAPLVDVAAASSVSSDFMFLLFMCKSAKAFRCLTNQSSDFGQAGQFFSALTFARLGPEG